MNNRIISSFQLLTCLSSLALAAPATMAPTGRKFTILPRDDSNDHPYYFPVGGIIAIPIAVVALIVVSIGLLRRKFRKPSTTPTPIPLVERTRTNTLPPYQREENSPDTTSNSSDGLVKPQDAPPAYAPPPNNSTAPVNIAASTNSTTQVDSTTPANTAASANTAPQVNSTSGGQTQGNVSAS